MEMKDVQYQLICQFLDGKLNREEVTALNNWRITSPDNEKQFQEVKYIWEKSVSIPTKEKIEIDVNTALHKVHRQIDQVPKVVNMRRRFLQIASAAAAVLLLITGFWMLQAPEMIEVATLPNEQKTITLPDESTVWLNENSVLRYPKSFDIATREVVMTGNAVFEVTHNKKQPFIVQSDKLSIKVLGTKFNVISGNDGTPSYVYVVNGKVQIKNNKYTDNQLVITKNMSVSLNPNTEKLALTVDYDSNQLFWMNQTLNFSNTPLEKVFQDLEKYYKIDVEIENTTLLSCPVNGQFKDKTVDEILESLQPIYNFEITKAKNTNYKITKGTCN